LQARGVPAQMCQIEGRVELGSAMTAGQCLHGEVSGGTQCTVGLPGVVLDTDAFSVQHNSWEKLAYLNAGHDGNGGCCGGVRSQSRRLGQVAAEGPHEQCIVGPARLIAWYSWFECLARQLGELAYLNAGQASDSRHCNGWESGAAASKSRGRAFWPLSICTEY